MSPTAPIEAGIAGLVTCVGAAANAHITIETPSQTALRQADAAKAASKAAEPRDEITGDTGNITVQTETEHQKHP